MKNPPFTIIAFFLSFNFICLAQSNNISEEVKKNINNRVDFGINTGIVVGLITPEGTSYYSRGVRSLETNKKVDEKSVFEIGSISKTFTGILLAEMVVQGELNLDDPLQIHLPEGITAPTRNGKSIQLFQLSNHTSSLPRLPDNMSFSNPANPYSDYTEEQLYDFIDSYELKRDIGSQYEYSNLGAGLLGHVLATKNNKSYEELMVEVIAKPLKMKSTRIKLSKSMEKNLAYGHNNGAQVENWDLPTLAGAGAIRSTAVDMIKYLATNLGINESDLYRAMQLSHKNSREPGSEPIVGLGWHTMPREEMEIVWHNGGTGGYRAFAGFIKDETRGVVVLTNSNAGVDDIGIHLLDPSFPLNNPKPSIGNKLKEIMETDGIETATEMYWELKENQKDDYDFGETQLNQLGYTFLENNEVQMAKAVFKLNVEAFPNSSNVYDSYAEALMKNDEKEKAITNYKKALELNPGNANSIAMLKKLGVDTEALIGEIDIEDTILQSYVGKYELAPGFIITVTKEGSQMKAQATGQPQFEIYKKSENVFYLKVVEAQVTFNSDEGGKVVSMTLNQAGQEVTGQKLELKQKQR